MMNIVTFISTAIKLLLQPVYLTAINYPYDIICPWVLLRMSAKLNISNDCLSQIAEVGLLLNNYYINLYNFAV